VNRVVTDQPPPSEWIDLLERNGIDLILPQPAAEAAKPE
jgi:hypothetical protein